MPTRKIAEPDEGWNRRPCRHPEHEPPKFRVFEPGTWEHECPACGHKVTFTVRGPVLAASGSLLETGGSVLPEGFLTRSQVRPA